MATGAEAIAVVQLIDACIGITSTIINIGNVVKDAQGLPPKLKELSEKIPAIDDLLSDARQNCEEGKVSESNAEIAGHSQDMVGDPSQCRRCRFSRSDPDSIRQGPVIKKTNRLLPLARSRLLADHIANQG